MQIDAHHHLWRYSASEYGWITGKMRAIARDFSPDDLQREMESSGMEGSVAVQARQTPAETDYLLENAEQHPFIRGVVGWVPLADANVAEDLERYADRPKLKGVRHVLHDEADDDYMLRADFQRGIRQLLRFGLVYDVLIFEKHLPQTISFVDGHPEQLFVVDHLAKPRIRDGAMPPWRDRLRELARRQHVVLKMSGVVTEADWQQWREQRVPEYLDIALEAFGPQRILFGSDWPVLTVAASYGEWVEMVRRQIEPLSADEQAAIMGGNAERVYRL